MNVNELRVKIHFVFFLSNAIDKTKYSAYIQSVLINEMRKPEFTVVLKNGEKEELNKLTLKLITKSGYISYVEIIKI